MTVLSLEAPDAAAFASFGRLVRAPDKQGDRAYYSEHLGSQKPGCAPVLHVNHVPPSVLPLTIEALERHPYAQQAFIPLNVAHYVVVVAPSDEDGAPVPSGARAFLLPGTIGVIYRRRVWHAGATVLDRPGNFAVLMWRAEDGEDDVFLRIDPLTVVAGHLGNGRTVEERAVG